MYSKFKVYTNNKSAILFTRLMLMNVSWSVELLKNGHDSRSYYLSYESAETYNKISNILLL